MSARLKDFEQKKHMFEVSFGHAFGDSQHSELATNASNTFITRNMTTEPRNAPIWVAAPHEKRRISTRSREMGSELISVAVTARI